MLSLLEQLEPFTQSHAAVTQLEPSRLQSVSHLTTESLHCESVFPLPRSVSQNSKIFVGVEHSSLQVDSQHWSDVWYCFGTEPAFTQCTKLILKVACYNISTVDITLNLNQNLPPPK